MLGQNVLASGSGVLLVSNAGNDELFQQIIISCGEKIFAQLRRSRSPKIRLRRPSRGVLHELRENRRRRPSAEEDLPQAVVKPKPRPPRLSCLRMRSAERRAFRRGGRERARVGLMPILWQACRTTTPRAPYIFLLKSGAAFYMTYARTGGKAICCRRLRLSRDTDLRFRRPITCGRWNLHEGRGRRPVLKNPRDVLQTPVTRILSSATPDNSRA